MGTARGALVLKELSMRHTASIAKVLVIKSYVGILIIYSTSHWIKQ